MTIDLNRLSTKELDSLINQARKRKTTLSKRKPIAVVRKKVAALIKAEGYTVAELFGGAAAPRAAKGGTRPSSRKGKALGKVAPKYRNPAKPAETWAGRGQQPRWLAALTGSGRSLDEFLIR